MFSLFLPIELLCCSRKEHIAAAVEGGFDGVLDNTDDKTDGYRLHDNIVTDTEERASHRDEEKRTMSFARSGDGGCGSTANKTGAMPFSAPMNITPRIQMPVHEGTKTRQCRDYRRRITRRAGHCGKGTVRVL